MISKKKIENIIPNYPLFITVNCFKTTVQFSFGSIDFTSYTLDLIVLKEIEYNLKKNNINYHHGNYKGGGFNTHDLKTVEHLKYYFVKHKQLDIYDMLYFNNFEEFNIFIKEFNDFLSYTDLKFFIRKMLTFSSFNFCYR